MLRLFVSSLMTATFAVGFAQDWTPQGQINSRETRIERREGNVVTGTEFVHFEYKVSLQVVPTGATALGEWITCNSPCKGKKHKKHEECDNSCDERCTQKHPVKLQGAAERQRSTMAEMTKASGVMAGKLGMPGGPANWSSATSNALKAIEAQAKSDKQEFDAGHVDASCAYSDRIYGYDVHDVKVKGEFWKVGFYMSGGVRTPINQMVDSHEGVVMVLYKTRKEALASSTSIYCNCKAEPALPPREPIGVIPGYKISGRTPTFSGLGWRKADGTVVIPDDKKVKVTCTGKGLSAAVLVVDNDSGEAYEVIIPAGTKLVPGDGGTQTMTCMGNQTAMVAAASRTTLLVSLQPEPVSFLQAPIDLRVACTMINKAQPSASTVFKIVPPDDTKLQRICMIEDSGFMRTAIGQGRVWIYTDAATREQINKHLLPGLTDGMYLNALHGLHRAGVDVTTARYRPLLDPTLLAASTASKDATFWYADLLRTLDPKMAYSKRVLDATRKVLAEKAEAIDARHAAYVALALSESDDKQIRMAVLDMMEKSIPEAHRAEFAKEGGLGAMLSIATFGDDSEAQRVFQVAKRFPGAETKTMLEGFANWGRESIRAAAEEAAKGM